MVNNTNNEGLASEQDVTSKFVEISKEDYAWALYQAFGQNGKAPFDFKIKYLHEGIVGGFYLASFTARTIQMVDFEKFFSWFKERTGRNFSHHKVCTKVPHTKNGNGRFYVAFTLESHVLRGVDSE